jgi:hypothetical protein
LSSRFLLITHDDIVVLKQEVRPEGYSGFQLPTSFGVWIRMLPDRIRNQIKHLRMLRDLWRSRRHEAKPVFSGIVSGQHC